MHESIAEDVSHVYSSSLSSSKVAICLDEAIPHQAPHVPAANTMWEPIEVNAEDTDFESKLWDKFSSIGNGGHRLIERLQSTWMRGCHGLPDGCKLKPCTAVAYNHLQTIPKDSHFHLHIYIDGSAQTVEDSKVMTWGMAVFKVDECLNHELIFSTGGLVEQDPSSCAYMGRHATTGYSALNLLRAIFALCFSMPDKPSFA